MKITLEKLILHDTSFCQILGYTAISVTYNGRPRSWGRLIVTVPRVSWRESWEVIEEVIRGRNSSDQVPYIGMLVYNRRS